MFCFDRNQTFTSREEGLVPATPFKYPTGPAVTSPSSLPVTKLFVRLQYRTARYSILKR